VVKSLWLNLRFPKLALNIAQRGLSPAQAKITTIAIIEKQRIFQVSEHTELLGLQAGMSLSSAWALLPSLSTVEREPKREQRAMTYLANWAYQFTPSVSHGGDRNLLLEVGGSLRLFQGLEALLQQVADGLRNLGFCYELGLAHTPAAAELLPYHPSRSAEPQECIQALRAQPLATLTHNENFSKNLQKKLQRVGIATLGELFDLPKASIAQRFGKDFVLHLQQLCGHSPDLRPSLTPKPEFASELHFLTGLSTIDMIRLPLTQLLQELQEFLIQRQLACGNLRWRFFHYSQQASILDIDLSRPQQSWENFFKLSEIKLGQISLDSAVESVQLYTRQLSQARSENQGLFKELSDNQSQDASLLIDKLTSRLGAERLYKLQIHDENLPELQQKRVPAGSKCREQNSMIEHMNPQHTQIPLWLCEQAQALSLRNNKLQYQGELDIVSSAKRFDSHWWQQRQQRDYFIARHAHGAHYWVYFDYINQRWFLQGIYG